jgi:competence protein ComEA
MSVLSALQNRFGFTRNEINAVALLAGTFILGSAIKWYRAPEVTDAPAFDYSRQDSEFIALSTRAVEQSGAEVREDAPRSGSRREPPPAPGSIDLNKATKAELVRLPGIGSSYAERILELRRHIGRFRSVDQLEQVKGIGKRRLEKIRPFLRIKKD